jgi:DNA helicase-2/ATP-dependent DNA helicase PcrA
MSIYDKLNPEQKEAVMHQYGPLLLLAGAGSGKTRVLTHRIARLIDEGVAPYHILALTFTNKAAKEMRERVDALVDFGAEDVWVGTFHSVCGKILRRSIEKIGYDSSFVIYDTDDQKTLMKDVLKYLKLDPKKFKERSVLSAISSAKNALLTPEAYQKSVQGDFLRETYALAYIEYQKRLVSNNALDFDDMIFRTIDLFRECPEELKKYQQRFQYIHVDEYQDTNYAQFQLISLLAPTQMEDGKILHNLCVVGDDDQSIYKFRGADISNILNFEKQFPETTVIKLEQNYRSTGNILSAANHVIKNNFERKDKKLWTTKEDGEPIHYCQLDTDFNEADYIISDIKKTVENGASYEDIAILYRTNAQSRLFEEKLVRNNIPYKLIGGVNFYQRKEIKDLLCYLKTIDNGRDDLAVKRIINVPKRGIGQTTIDRISAYALSAGISFYEALLHAAAIPGVGRAAAKLESFTAMIEMFKQKAAKAYEDPANPDYTFRDLLDDILEVTGYDAELKAEGDPQSEARLENIEELKNKIAFYEQNAEEIPSLSAFLEEVSLVADIDSMENGTNVVVLMTLHSAKGLEFPYVYLAGMEDGIFPSYMCISSDDPSDLEEERRLCYVGITRAMNRLTMTGARQRMQHGETQFNKPSRFIREIPRYLMTEEAGSLQPRFAPASRFSAEELPAVDIFADIQDEDRVPWDEDADSVVDLEDYREKPKGMSPAEFMQRQKSMGRNNGMGRDASLRGFSSGQKVTRTSSDPFEGNPFIKKGVSSYSPSVSPIQKKNASSLTGQAPDYQIGDQVRHVKFGVGTVMNLVKGPRDYQVTVDFGEQGMKKMMAAFAKLVPVQK